MHQNIHRTKIKDAHKKQKSIGSPKTSKMKAKINISLSASPTFFKVFTIVFYGLILSLHIVMLSVIGINDMIV